MRHYQEVLTPAGRADGCVGYVDRDQGEPSESRFAAIACAGTGMRNLEEKRFDFALVRSGCRGSAALLFQTQRHSPVHRPLLRVRASPLFDAGCA